jgi:hypothetical protein
VDIIIRTIEHDQQRLGQAGDWRFDSNGNLLVEISYVENWRMEFLYGLHELLEAVLCRHAGITTEMVDKDDAELDAKGAKNDPESFSGYPGSCYQPQHNTALSIEWLMSQFLGVDWAEYSKAYDPLWDSRPNAPKPSS